MKKIAPHCIVELKYTLRESGGEGSLLEIMDEQWPLKFFFGGGAMLPAFEERLLGLPEGGAFTFTLSANEAYGALDPAQIREVPLQDLPESENFPNKVYEVGDRLVFNMGQNDQMLGTVSEVLSHSLLVDFNHALAGKDLYFEGQVLYIRSPSEEELLHKRYIEPNGIRSGSRMDDDTDV